MKKIILIQLIASWLFAANYTLDIINIDETGVNNRIKFAYTNIEYKVRIAAHGGVYPFTWELTANPSGMVIDSETGSITWSNPTETGSPHTVTVRVTDSESSTDAETYTLTVTTSTDRFVWMDYSNNAGGRDGSYSNPYRDFDDWFSEKSGSHGGKIMYLRSGTYDFSGIAGHNHRSHGEYALYFSSDYHPIAYLAYPGETARFDGTQGFDGINTGKSWAWWVGDHDLYYYGITFQNLYGHAFDIDGSNYSVWHDCIFTDLRGYSGYQNDAFIFWRNGGTNTKNAVLGCTLEDGTNIYASGLKLYDSEYFVIEDCTFDNLIDVGLSFKASTHYCIARHNTFNQAGNGISISSFETGTSNNEIVCNYIHDSNNYGILIDSEPGVVGQTFIDRNTIIDGIQIRYLVSADGIFYFRNNVIVNTESNSDGDSGDHIYNRHSGPDGRISETHIVSETNSNLVHTTTTNLVDNNGLLIGSWAKYSGKKGWQILKNLSSPKNVKVVR